MMVADLDAGPPNRLFGRPTTLTVEQAYALQTEIARLREGRGERVIGYKIGQRLQTLAGLFAVDVLGFTVMTNHIHLVLRIRPDMADRWDD